MKKYKTITLCGSIKFKDEFLKVQEELTLKGNIVLTPNFFNSLKKEDIDEKTKEMLDEMHKQKNRYVRCHFGYKPKWLYRR